MNLTFFSLCARNMVSLGGMLMNGLLKSVAHSQSSVSTA